MSQVNPNYNPQEEFEINRRELDIGNYYGCLNIAKVEGKYYWCIENYTGFHPKEITKELYDALLIFNNKEK